jgi:uncharacterized protein YciI
VSSQGARPTARAIPPHSRQRGIRGASCASGRHKPAFAFIPSMEFDRYTIVLLRSPESPLAVDARADNALQDAHLDHLAKLHEAGHLLAAGPCPGEPGRRLRGLSIFKGGPEEARALAERDPAVRAGVFVLEVHPWMVPRGAIHFSTTRFPHSAKEAQGD